MSTRWTRAEIAGILAARHGQPEGTGEGGMLTLTIKVSPELLEGLLGGTWTNADGTIARFEGVFIDDTGYAEPILTRVEAQP
jgi:hypothetical protein